MTAQLHPSRWYDADPELAAWLERLPMLPESTMASLLDTLSVLVGVSAADIAMQDNVNQASSRWYDSDIQLKAIMHHLKTAPLFVQQSAVMVIRQAWADLATPLSI